MSAKGGIKLNGSLENGSLGFTMWERHSKVFFWNKRKEGKKEKKCANFFIIRIKNGLQKLSVGINSLHVFFLQHV